MPLSSARVSKADHSTDKSDGPRPCAPVQEHPSSQILGRQNWRHQKRHVSSSISWALMVTFKSYFNTENRYVFVVGLFQTLNIRWEEKDSSGITIWTLRRAPCTAHSSALTRVFSVPSYKTHLEAVSKTSLWLLWKKIPRREGT